MAFYRKNKPSKYKRLFKKSKLPCPVKHIYTSKNPKDEEFFSSQEWRSARYFTLKKYGRTCMLCGHIGGEIHVDHIKPRISHPHLALNYENLQVLCKECNLGKSYFDDTDFRPK